MDIAKNIKRLKLLALEMFFPAVCLNCVKYLHSWEEKDNLLCNNCFNSIEISEIIHRPDPSILLFSVGSYSNTPMRELIHNLKFNLNLRTQKPIEKLVKNYIKKSHLEKIISRENSIIIPIPLHKKRLKKRGFNQAEIIADILGKELGILVEKRLLERVKNTAPQIEMDGKKAREENIKGCFTTHSGVMINHNTARISELIIVDDIYTSGSTILEAAKTLNRKLKPAKIIGFTLAKA
ncbi:MAG: ComF family protein [Candidatus Colwellbacteria bacterium]|nr:ComF family protein [Candidatus Colwellbacteria bacterium]